MQPIILFGTGRSGTTILMEALFKHRELAYISNYLEQYPNVESLNLLRYAFDNKLYRIFGQKKQLYKVSKGNKIIFKPTEGYNVWEHLCGEQINFSKGFARKKSIRPDTKRRINNYFKRLKYLQGKKRIAFKVTGPSRLHFFERVFDYPTYIRMSRGFIPTLSSFLRVDFWKAHEKGQLAWESSAYSEEELDLLDFYKDNTLLFTAIQLKKVLDIADREIEELGLNVYELNYEEFTQDPRGHLERILEYLDLAEDPACFQYLENNKVVNRNKPSNAYFSKTDLAALKAVIGEEFFNR